MAQTVQIIQKMQDKKRDFVVVSLEMPDEEVYKRLAKRANADGSQARKDDIDEQAIRNRIASFHRDTMPALKWVEEQGFLVRVDGMRSEAEIFAEILEIIQD